MKKVTVSIVIPTKDRSDQLLRLLQSIAKSEYQDYEVIIVNDSSKKIAISNQYTFVENHANKGLAYSRKQGALKSSGKYVLFIDDDNVIDSQMISNLVSSLEAHPALLAVGPLTYYFSHPKKVWFVGARLDLRSSRAHFSSVTDTKQIKGNLFHTDNLHNCFMIRKELGDEVGWFDEFIFMSGTEFDLFQRIKRLHQHFFVATNLQAVCYHDVPIRKASLLRSLGFENKNRVYYFQRNRGLFTGRYGSWLDKLTIAVIFYPLFTIIYGALFVSKGRFDFFLTHIIATGKGYKLLFTAR